MEYLVTVETGDEGSCTYSRFLWVNTPPEVADTDLRTSEGAQESAPRIKNIYYCGPVFSLETSLYRNRREWLFSCYGVGFFSYLTPCPVHFTFTYVADSKAVLPAQDVVLSFRVMELVPWWAFPMNVTGYEIWLRVEFSVFHPNFLLFPHSLSCQKKWQSCRLCSLMDCGLPGTSVRGFLQARILEWIAVPLLQGIVPTQGSNPGLPHCRRILYRLSHQGTRSPAKRCHQSLSLDIRERFCQAVLWPDILGEN